MSMRVGIDLVCISRIAESLRNFGDCFLRRIFTEAEIAYATAAPALTAERLAARFAAKEAAFKALGLAGRGIGWRQVEVSNLDSGECVLLLHGDAADGVQEVALSLSHEGDYATAVVMTHLLTSRRT